MSFSQFFVLSPRGDSVLFKDFRGDLRSNPETFFRTAKFWDGKQQDAPPIFNFQGVSYIYIRKNSMYFVLATLCNVSPLLAVELLHRITKLFKDYCGLLTEESLRANFVLCYELLDEIMDFGYVQTTSAEQLKAYVFNEPVVVKSKDPNKKKNPLVFPQLSANTISSSAVDKPISLGGGGADSADGKRRGKAKNEIFVDIIERINTVFNANGYILKSSIDGTIQMKSYLSGNPPLRLALNEDLVVGGGGGGGGGGARNASGSGAGSGTAIDDCNFHECVRLEDFENHRMLSLQPPDGEFVVMNYRVSDNFRVPFRAFPFFEMVSPYKVELIVKLRADIPAHTHAVNVTMLVPVPKTTASATVHPAPGAVGQMGEFSAAKNAIRWRVKKFVGGTEQTVRIAITLKKSCTASIRKEIGPINLSFEIPMYNPSNLQVRYLRVMENARYNPFRWVRYVTVSDSYVCRL